MNVDYSTAVTAKLYLPTDAAEADTWDPDGREAITVLELVQRRAAEAAGGFTMTRGEGGWMNDDGEIVTEPVRVISVTFDNPADAREWAHHVAKKVKRATSESMVLAEAAGEAIQIS